MSIISKENAADLLTDLIAIPSVNPMGRPYERAETVEGRVADYIQNRFAPYGVRMERDRYSATHENLLLILPGRSAGPYTLFESHMDTVPADDWSDRAFVPRREGDLIFGRGACDDKGCLAAMILAVTAVLESETPPASPILFLAAGDEEHAQTGIKRFRDYPYPVARGVFGEPTNCVPVVQHKGTIRWDITVHGRSAHTSRPELGMNAILGMMDVIAALGAHQAALQQRYTSPLMTGPLLTVSMIHGGRTRNAVPDECTISVDFRLIPGMEPEAAQQEVFQLLSGMNLEISHSEPQLKTPPMSTSPTDPFAQHVLEICRQSLGPDTRLEGVPYGTDAAWISDRAPALVLGPGSIVTAHAVEEHIDVNEVVQCAEIYRQILVSDYS
jgi:acetylornithine deacetylase